MIQNIFQYDNVHNRVELNMPLVEPKIGYGNLPRGYRGQRIYK